MEEARDMFGVVLSSDLTSVDGPATHALRGA